MTKRRVVKVGGSLLSNERLPERLGGWFDANDDLQNIVVVGGGALADTIRGLQKTMGLSETLCHHFACQTMSITAAAVAACFPESRLIDQFEQIGHQQQPVIVFDSCQWIATCDDVLAGWEFTSDSIAAKLATEIQADELVLLKSRAGSLTEPGFVDGCFADESISIKAIRIDTLGP